MGDAIGHEDYISSVGVGDNEFSPRIKEGEVAVDAKGFPACVGKKSG